MQILYGVCIFLFQSKGSTLKGGIQLLINGKEMTFPAGLTVNKLLEHLGINPDQVVVQVNLGIVSKDEYANTALDSNDKVEILSFVGGG